MTLSKKYGIFVTESNEGVNSIHQNAHAAHDCYGLPSHSQKADSESIAPLRTIKGFGSLKTPEISFIHIILL